MLTTRVQLEKADTIHYWSQLRLLLRLRLREERFYGPERGN